uniref:Uncharacterized protein n=4 Tax=environmental samples TaxID=651140 RepID=A0A075I3G9_9ARCH|nr:hypothetical protein [uncultured marine thaumarchaeote SAT1000_09_B07]AIF22368.1 hypothetical protein [uncultured marine thaumarchaeote SAT1000_09_B08]AIF22426.1 hypothetical protein [uncultured marine thaumarchaeote SAT1000_09_C07]AIF22484.1 hypothetical protein [uncultured marine thaumarchaeote SAT1000_09_C08]
MAVEAVFKSWMGERAVIYREKIILQKVLQMEQL